MDDEAALKHLQEKYQRFLAGVVTNEDVEKRSEKTPEEAVADA